MVRDRKGLEGKFNAAIGDLVILRNPERDIEVGGYVFAFSIYSVSLSHENPLKNRTKFLMRDMIGFGDRKYYLDYFTEYEVVSKKVSQEVTE